MSTAGRNHVPEGAPTYLAPSRDAWREWLAEHCATDTTVWLEASSRPDLAERFAANPAARENFDRFPISSRRLILEWIVSAKRPETRGRRIDETVESAARNVRAHH